MQRWPLNKTYFWETAPFFRLLLPLAVGILFYDRQYIPPIPPDVLLPLLVITALLCIGFFNRASRPISFALLYALLFFIGYGITYTCDAKNNASWFGRDTSGEPSYLAVISDEPLEKDKTWKLPLSIAAVMHHDTVKPVSGKALLYLYKDSSLVSLHKGDSIIVPGDWQPIKNAGNPFEFDYAGYCRQNNILLRQSCSTSDLLLFAKNNPTANSITDKVHAWCMHQLDLYIPDIKTRGLIQAMILGDEVNLDDDIRQAYAATGIVHIIAISGGNVAIFFIIISTLLWWLRHKKYIWIKYALALPLVWFYVVMAGAAPSAIRAALMFSLLAFGIIFEKNANSLNHLFATAFILLCAQPMWLFAIGFQLSFTAVLSLILFYPAIYKRVAPVNKILRLLWGTVAASIAAEILVAPLVIYYFHMFPLLFIVANVAAYIFMSIVLVLGIAIIISALIPVIASVLGKCTIWLVTLFDHIIDSLQHYNPQPLRTLVLNGFELFLVYLFIAAIATFVTRKRRVSLYWALSSLSLLFCSFCVNEWARIHQQRLVVYNIPGINHIELIQGATYATAGVDTPLSFNAKYITTTAHIGWRANEDQPAAVNETFLIGNKKVLILNSSGKNSSPFPVDVLILNTTGAIDDTQLMHSYAPSLVVIGNNYGRNKQTDVCNRLKAAGIPVYPVAESGAFIIE